MAAQGSRESRAAGPVGAGVRLAAGLLEGAWALVFGPPDLGAADFAALRRRRTANDALACPDGFCPAARPNLVAPVFPVPPECLRALLAEAALAEPGAVRLPAAEGRDRFLVRTRFLRFPDTVDAQVLAAGAGGATLALYSRSRIGGYDFGANPARLRRWLARIGERASAAA